jgi:lipoprotein NlpI
VIADSTAALRAEPNYEGALRVRGLARLYAGRPKAAIDDFAAAVRLTPSDALGVILLHIAQVRAQQSDDQEFAANVARVDRREWPGRLVEVLTGGATADQVGDFLMAVRDENVRFERICEARVYLGLLQLAARDKGEARKLFSAAVSIARPPMPWHSNLRWRNWNCDGSGTYLQSLRRTGDRLRSLRSRRNRGWGA